MSSSDYSFKTWLNPELRAMAPPLNLVGNNRKLELVMFKPSPSSA